MAVKENSTERVRRYLAEASAVLSAIDPVTVADLVAALGELWERDATLFVVGNGGSASTAGHMAADLSKQTAIPGRRPLRAVSLADNPAILTAWANDAGFSRVFAEQVAAQGRRGDALLCISCSGTSDNILEAISAAREAGLAVFSMGGFGENAMAAASDIHVHVGSKDYGQVESMHLVLNHCLATLIREAANVPAPEGAGPLVIVDRDGVINRNREGHVLTWEQFEFLPGALAALAELHRSGHRVAVISNQAAVGRGLLTPAQLTEIHRRMCAEVIAAGGRVDAVYHCPHTPEEGCGCRKPAPGLVLKALECFGVPAGAAILVGDHHTDIEAARAAGTRSIYVRSGRGGEPPSDGKGRPDQVADDLGAAVALITMTAPAGP